MRRLKPIEIKKISPSEPRTRKSNYFEMFIAAETIASMDAKQKACFSVESEHETKIRMLLDFFKISNSSMLDNIVY